MKAPRLLIPLMIAAIAGFPALTPHPAQAAEKKSTMSENAVRNVNATEASREIASRPGLVILDVRTAEEFNAGHLLGAVNVDYQADNFKELLAGLDKNAPYLVHCRSGARSGRAVPLMQEVGITDITHLDGGIEDWVKQGLPITTD